ncbi:MAG: phosphoenolpyruvate synthase [Candidatus Babeliaceae bacterium]|nr:phosphoenolpyruvate synthase [Candidatus Babeliaceae bacterium]
MHFIKFFNEITLEDSNLVGGKNASLGQMMRDLSSNVRIPHGFAVTVDAYHYFIRSSNLQNTLDSFSDNGSSIRAAIIAAQFPQDLKEEISQAYLQLCKESAPNLSVAVRSSATSEDSAAASFAGQQESFLHISGIAALLDAIKKCMASLFTDRAIAYRKNKGFDIKDIGISVGVQKMVNSDAATSGVMFTLETESGHPDFITINASYGLGEAIVGGTVNPDEFMVYKQKLRDGYKPLVKKVCGDKQVAAQYNALKNSVEIIPVDTDKRQLFCLSDEQIFELAGYGLIIEDYFSARTHTWSPMDIEWAQDSIDKKLYIVQARPETVHAHQDRSHVHVYELLAQEKPQIILTGLSIGRKIAAGKVVNMLSPQDTDIFQEGDIVVTQMTDPDWVPIMKKAAAIITDRGGRTCHAAIVARELGVPAVVGTQNATKILKDGDLVTVDCSQGTQGFVYAEKILFKTQEYAVNAKKLPVELLVTLADPDRACEVSLLPVQGAGLVRLEFIIAQHIGIHPMAILFPEKVDTPDFKKRAQEIAVTYSSLENYYIQMLSQGIGLISAAFYPRPVIVRLTDFKTNEYRDLLGGSVFEPHEENPMLGFRGASRYGDSRYAPAFELECKALKKVLDTMGFQNMIIMIPFVRTVAEAQATLQTLAKNGLERGRNGLKIYLMVEIPANVILFEQFEHYFDGFSIGSNDLTQLTLGVDRDSGVLHNLFNENDAAVKALIAQAIYKAHGAGKHIGICGQAPSDYPDFAQWLIAEKIDALSLNSDAILPFILNYR